MLRNLAPLNSSWLAEMGSASLKSASQLSLKGYHILQPSSAQNSNVASKLIEPPVRCLCLHLPIQLAQLRPLSQLRCGRQTRPDLQVRLPVKIGRLNVAHSLRLRGGEEDEVSGEVVAIVHHEDVANLHLPPCFLHPLALTTEHSHFGIVHFSVTIVPFDVLDDLLYRDHCEDEEEGHNGDISPCGGNPWDLLQQPNCQEEYVGVPVKTLLRGFNWQKAFDPPSELLKKKSWDESDEVVLGRRDLVVLKLFTLKDNCTM